MFSPLLGSPISHSNLAPSSSERPVFLVSKETRNQTQQTYLMGSSTQLSDPHVMGLGFILLKDKDVQTERCKAVGPGSHWGTLPGLLGPRLLERPGPVLSAVEDTRDTHHHPLSLVQTLEISEVPQSFMSLHTAPFEKKR